MKKKKFFSFWPDRQEKIFELLQEAKLAKGYAWQDYLVCKTSFRLTNFQRYADDDSCGYQINRLIYTSYSLSQWCMLLEKVIQLCFQPQKDHIPSVTHHLIF